MILGVHALHLPIPLLMTVSTLKAYLDGVTLAPILSNPSTAEVKQAAFSEFVKCYSCCKGQPDNGPANNTCARTQCTPKDPKGLTELSEMETCFLVPREQISFIGYSMRTPRWRYTEWLHFNGTILHGDFNRRVAVWGSLLETTLCVLAMGNGCILSPCVDGVERHHRCDAIQQLSLVCIYQYFYPIATGCNIAPN
jgi:hypothetical protein